MIPAADFLRARVSEDFHWFYASHGSEELALRTRIYRESMAKMALLSVFEGNLQKIRHLGASGANSDTLTALRDVQTGVKLAMLALSSAYESHPEFDAVWAG